MRRFSETSLGREIRRKRNAIVTGDLIVVNAKSLGIALTTTIDGDNRIEVLLTGTNGGEVSWTYADRAVVRRECDAC